MAEQHYRDRSFSEEMLLGCTQHRWAVAVRVMLMLVTLGISELVRGEDGWCACCYSSPQGEVEPMAQRGHYMTRTRTGTQSSSAGDIGSRGANGHGIPQYPVSAYGPGEGDMGNLGANIQGIPQYPVSAYGPTEPEPQTTQTMVRQDTSPFPWTGNTIPERTSPSPQQAVAAPFFHDG
ncbi:hypothetical protein J3459_018084 [Metarhizium acridum]|uniref:Uncharacterized protein n=1 Tax=Metarhizium acridum (strain CQMa 102) TaxID=655827 RepID=E9E678_METAQ|nr:uncharacterized protein MAC_05376 [Metarhizium acridum CQMa 102]EFY88611.1 hypothetical protein MAC_05376 [Metarhizium acridum CQMa 102]KAG8408221.1 hypothetical protein J3459_018084 [Metarhizium acridum]KAG8410278.1 hypothetical protein J3458_017991 [Metarhizium acridum]